MKRRFAWLLALAALSLGAAGCNTVEGFGKDMKATGTAVEKAAAKTRSY